MAADNALIWSHSRAKEQMLRSGTSMLESSTYLKMSPLLSTGVKSESDHIRYSLSKELPCAGSRTSKILPLG